MNSQTTFTENSKGWIRLFGAIVFVIVVAGIFAYLIGDRSTSQSRPKSDPVIAFDTFNHSSANGSLGRINKNYQWASVSGQWAIDGGVAHSLATTSGSSFAVVEIGNDASVSASTTGRSSCGLVAVFSDLSNFVSLQRDDKEANWKIIVIRDAKPETIGSVGGIAADNNRISLLVDPPVVTAVSGGNHSSFVVENLPTGTQAGLFTTGPASTLCTFDDVTFVTPSQ